MEILTKYELRLRKREIIEKIKAGAIFIHPTDTIYGIGCNAQDEKAVKKIRELKNRYESPFSVWAPSREWIKQNCLPTLTLTKWVKELPGRYTLIIRTHKKRKVAPNVNYKDQHLGIRIPDHWFHEIIREINIPIVTTSANKKGESFMTCLEDLDRDIKKEVDFIIYEGKKKARPSKLINLLEEEKITER